MSYIDYSFRYVVCIKWT